ncbi:MAG: CDP-glucose 4,6-dehydratase [Ruminococcus sp.]|nr:CDP-glucose 4,6-dehydratase [Ruminococcus sp.]
MGGLTVINSFDLSFYKGKRVFITGHTGFKGSWLCRFLLKAGADVTGYALAPAKPSLFDISDIAGNMVSVTGDIRDLESLKAAFEKARPEMVFHLAAQPIVKESYKNPAYTYETNVMGTVNILECIRESNSVRSFLNVTTDKVYLNREWEWGYRENEELNGFDPYSNSKSCSELVTGTYKNCYLNSVGVSTARAGNVIGGGDFSADRIVPDCIRAVTDGRKIAVRNPHSVRPYQHVLEALTAYLIIVQGQYERPETAGCYNVGPDEGDCITTAELTELFCKCWGEGAAWENRSESNAPKEANFLKLDCSRLKSVFGWKPVWHVEKAMEEVCRFTKVQLSGGDVSKEMDREIEEFLEDMSK